MALTEVALFPIPNCVSFPGTVYPLHVFEPRYRDMVRHCLETGTYMAVCHTSKELHPARPNQTREEALQSNQATYKPCEVFSAGPCELLEALPDGRMLIHVYLQNRYRAVTEKQLLPFSIYGCEEVTDTPLNAADREALDLLKEKILKRLQALTANNPRLQALLESEDWQNKTPEVFSFEIFGIVHLEPELQQQILEYRSATRRLELLLELLNEVGGKPA